MGKLPYNVLVTRPIPESGLALLRDRCEHIDVNPDDRPLSRTELLDAVRGRDGLLTMVHDPIDADVLDAAGPACRVIANMAVGFDNFDVAAATARGVMLTNTPDVLTDATADLAWALLLAVARRVVESDRHFRSGAWSGWGPMQFLGGDITGATLGVVGAGRIGTAMALKSRGFDMPVLYCDAVENTVLEQRLGARRVDLATLLTDSDYVSLHVSLLPETRHMIDRAMLARMKPTAYLINTSRGPVVDEAALVQALGEGRIAGAGLDVYENEPQPAPGLIELDNVVCLPHIGSATSRTRGKMAMMAAEAIVAALDGRRPAHLVNPDVWRDASSA